MSTEITAKGIIASGFEETRRAVAEDWQVAFRDPENPEQTELNTASYTPQGQLIDSETAVIMDKDAQFQIMAANMNPMTATGVWQDAIGAIYFIPRKGSAPTYVMLTCTGLSGTVLPGKSQPIPAIAETENRTRFICTSTAAIGADGTVKALFESMIRGPIPASPGSVSRIYRAIPGWDSVINEEAGLIGTKVESRLDYERRRRVSVAKNATGSVSAIYANVAALDGVTDCLVEENVSWQDKIIGSVTLSPKSIYVAVIGGTDKDIAETIYKRNSGGTDTNGTSSYLVKDPASGAEEDIFFQRAESRPFKVRVTSSGAVSESVKELIRQAVYNNAQGLTEAAGRIRIGETVYASRFYCALNGQGVILINIQVACKGSDVWGDSVSSEIFEVLTLEKAEDVEVLP